MGNRTRRLRIGIGVILTCALILPAPAAAAAEESTLTWELGAEGAVVEEHTGQLLWNLNTDNIVRSGVSVGWNSMYLREAGTLTGNIVADYEAETLAGEFTESWVCDGDCLASDGSPSYATTMDTGWTATLGDVRLARDGSGWDIEGTILIVYHAAVTSIESPSECNGETCYICENQLCVISEQMSASAALEGWIDGETISLAFQDRLEPDASLMNFDGLRDIQFFMSRFSTTITGTVAAAPPPPPGETVNSGDDRDAADDDLPAADSGAVEAPTADGSTADSSQIASPAADGSDADAAEVGGNAAPQPDPQPTDEDPDSLAIEVITILIILGLGGTAWIVLRKRDWFVPRKVRKRWDRLPPPAPAVEPPKPSDPKVATYVVGETTMRYETTIEEVEAPPTYTLVNPGPDPTEPLQCIDDHGQIHTVDPGREVLVMRRAGTKVEVQIPGLSPFWVDKNQIKQKSPPLRPR